MSDGCPHSDIYRYGIAREGHGLWKCRECGDEFVPAFRLQALQTEHVEFMNRYHDKNEALHAAQSRLDEALERDRKGDQIIVELTLDRDNLAGRLEAHVEALRVVIGQVQEEWQPMVVANAISARPELRNVIEACWPGVVEKGVRIVSNADVDGSGDDPRLPHNQPRAEEHRHKLVDPSNEVVESNGWRLCVECGYLQKPASE